MEGYRLRSLAVFYSKHVVLNIHKERHSTVGVLCLHKAISHIFHTFLPKHLQISNIFRTFAPVIHQPAIEPEHRLQAHCTDTVLGDYCVVIVWLLCDIIELYGKRKTYTGH